MKMKKSNMELVAELEKLQNSRGSELTVATGDSGGASDLHYSTQKAMVGE